MSRNPTHYVIRVFLLVVAIGIQSASQLPAQDRFQLSTRDQQISSTATMTSDELVIQDQQGNVSRYKRDAKFDSPDGRWIGFINASVRQVIRWPKSNQGNMEIGRSDGRGKIQYRPSQMTIDAQSETDAVPPPPAPSPILPPGEASDAASDRNRDDESEALETSRELVPIRLTQERAGQQQFLSRVGGGGFSLVPQVAGAVADWMLVPLTNGLIRIQFRQGNQSMALGCNRQSRLGFSPIGSDAGQLWRVYPFLAGSGYVFESVMFPGQCLTWGDTGLFMQPISFAPRQIWSPFYPPIPRVEPVLRNLSTQVVPNPPLEPAHVELANRHTETVWVLLADHRAGGAVTTYRIPSGASETVKLDRDAGAVVEETYEVLLNTGEWNRQVFRTPIPPALLYDISIYEEFLQSIAIDRTGKSPNTIEDINYQPKSIGWFLIPPGDSIPAQYVMDVFDLAKTAGNPGAVRRIDPKQLDKPVKAEDPLKAILREIQAQRGAF